MDTSINILYTRFKDNINKKFQGGYLTKLLPIYFKLKGKPYDISNYIFFEPFYGIKLPTQSIFKTGRQISKTTNLAAKTILHAAVNEYYNILSVTPTYPQIYRFVTLYINPFLDNSLIGELIFKGKIHDTLQQKTFTNNSTLFFEHCFKTVDRIRGISADELNIDEVQDIDIDFLPVILETLEASEYRISYYTGTPKTLDNTIQKLWDESSQAEWCIPCSHCGYYNICTIEQDLMKMIGSETLICAKCSKSIEGIQGFWLHTFPEKRHIFAGYHIPQPILPRYYKNKQRWKELLDKISKWPADKVHNEILGESYDRAKRLITKQELQQACSLPFENKISESIKVIGHYYHRVMGIDWSGGGEESLSFTKIAIGGMTPTGIIDIIYSEDLTRFVKPEDELDYIIKLYKLFKISYISHDFTGAGTIRQVLLAKSGIPVDRIIPIWYVGITSRKSFFSYNKKASTPYYSLDKTRSLVLICMAIRHHLIRFPSFTSMEHLLNDFLALVEDVTVSTVREIYRIMRSKDMCDDYAHAVNFTCISLWHIYNRYPEFAELMKYVISKEEEDQL